MSGAVMMTTVSDRDDADRLATGLLERGHAACVQQVSIESRYRWEGEVRSDPEVLLLVKTTDEASGAAMTFLEQEHPYDVPEIVTLAPTAVSAPYLAWMTSETGGESG